MSMSHATLAVDNLRKLQQGLFVWRSNINEKSTIESVEERDLKTRTWDEEPLSKEYPAEASQISSPPGRLLKLQTVCIDLSNQMASLEQLLLSPAAAANHEQYATITKEMHAIISQMITIPELKDNTDTSLLVAHAVSSSEEKRFFQCANYPEMMQRIANLRKSIDQLPSPGDSGITATIYHVLNVIYDGLKALARIALYGLGAGVIGLGVGAAIGGPAGAVVGAFKGAATGVAAAYSAGGVVAAATAVPAALGPVGCAAGATAATIEAPKQVYRFLCTMFAPDPVQQQMNETLTALAMLGRKTCTSM